VTVSDPVADPGSISCVPAIPGTLAPGESISCAATHTVTQADLDAGSVTNTATATGTPPSGPPVSGDSEAVTVPAEQAPAVSIRKSTTAAALGSFGDEVDFEFTVTNTGNVTLTDIVVSDPKTTGPQCPATTLAPGESMVCTATHTVTAQDVAAGRYTNVATVSSSSTAGPLEPIDSNEIVLTNPTPPPPAPLPRTGAEDLGGKIRLALQMLLSGALLVAGSRRRRTGSTGTAGALPFDGR
jgi:uncharacterized repeat protein (TIGR01451 family)